MKVTVCIYQVDQIPVLKDYLRQSLKTNEVVVFALGADVEFVLSNEKISFVSAQSYRAIDPLERLVLAENLAQNILKDNSLSFLTHRNVPFGRVHGLALQQYLAVLFYYIDIFNSYLKEQLPQELIVLESHQMAFVGDVLADFVNQVVVEAAYIVGNDTNIKIQVIPMRHKQMLIAKKYTFLLRRLFFGVAMHILNIFVSIMSPPKKTRFIISDMWRNFGPYLQCFPNAEAIVWERTEFRNMQWKEILDSRIRFMHASAFRTPFHRYRSFRKTLYIKSRWQTVKRRMDLLESAQFLTFSVSSNVTNALERIVQESSKDILDIEDIYAMLLKVRPHAVLVRASESVQTHFAFLCYVARSLGIPSVEVQHGLLYLGPGSFASHMSAEYVATYGPLASQEFHALGYDMGKLLNTGSPRFDVCKTAHQKQRSFTNTDAISIAYIVSTTNPGWWIDPYDIAFAICTWIEVVKNMEHVHITFALRPDSPHTPYLKNLIEQESMNNEQITISSVSLSQVMSSSDLVVSGFSTVLFESLLRGNVVIFDATMRMYQSIREHSFIMKKLSLPFVTNKTEIQQLLHIYSASKERDRLQKQLSREVQDSFVADGSASKHFVDAVNRLSS